MAEAERNIVVFYHARKALPLRASNEAHLLCWHRHSAHRTIYVNVAFGVPWWLLRHIAIDAVIFDTIFLSMHWDPEYFRAKAAACLPVRDLRCLKIALPQDQFVNIATVACFLAEIGVTDVLDLAGPADWPRIYPELNPQHVRFRRILTGYVDESRIDRLPRIARSPRPIDIGYRAWRNPYWLGEHGTHKVRIAEAVAPAARARGLNVDISTPAATDFLIGDRWFEFLLRCRAVLGVEGGASVCDRDGSIMCRVEAYVAAHPKAGFEEVREQCFPAADHAVNLACLSPRHFEACLTRTCQILLEGEYNGVFKPWLHYIPIKRDYSNLAEALDALADDALVERIVERAYEDIVASGRYSYRMFVRDIETTLIERAVRAPRRGSRLLARLCIALLRIRDSALWRFAHGEARVLPRLRNSWCWRAARHVRRALRRSAVGTPSHIRP
jgi:hypothetical protein